MNICSRIKKKFNTLRMRGIKEMTISKELVSEEDIKDLKECGYFVKEILQPNSPVKLLIKE